MIILWEEKSRNISDITNTICTINEKMIFKRKPKLPNLFLYWVSMDSEGWDNLFLSFKDYFDNSHGKSLYEEDLEILKEWRENNPNWEINAVTQKIWKI